MLKAIFFIEGEWVVGSRAFLQKVLNLFQLVAFIYTLRELYFNDFMYVESIIK